MPIVPFSDAFQPNNLPSEIALLDGHKSGILLNLLTQYPKKKNQTTTARNYIRVNFMLIYFFINFFGAHLLKAKNPYGTYCCGVA